MKRIVASLIVLAATSSAHALEFDGEMYMVGSVGRIGIKQAADNNILSSGTENGVTTTPTNVQSAQRNTRTGYKLQLGYTFSPHFAIEGGYVELGKTTNSATYSTSVSYPLFGPLGGPTIISAGANGTITRVNQIYGWNIAGVGIYPVNDAFSLFAKLGMIDAKVKSSTAGVGLLSSASETSDSAWKAYYGIGAAYYPNPEHDLGFRLEYERFSKIGDLNSTGSSDVNLMSLGVSSQF